MNPNAGPYAEIGRQLASTPFGSIEYREETTSTNADAAALLGDAAFLGHTIVAEYQRHGAGRKGRTWEAAAGTSLLFTTILPCPVVTECLWLVPFWVALAAGDALHQFGIATILQWPNDLLLEEKKIAGILCQSRIAGGAASVACGVGINVRRTGASLEQRSPDVPDTWAFCEDVRAVERAALLRAVLLAYDRTLPMLEHPSEVTDRWEEAAGVPGRRYRILRDDARTPFEAVAVGLEPGGALRVQLAGGTVDSVEMADARVLR